MKWNKHSKEEKHQRQKLLRKKLCRWKIFRFYQKFPINSFEAWNRHGDKLKKRVGVFLSLKPHHYHYHHRHFINFIKIFSSASTNLSKDDHSRGQHCEIQCQSSEHSIVAKYRTALTAATTKRWSEARGV